MAELIIIGSGTGVPSLRRSSPALFLVSDKTKVLIDSGPGALRKMLEVGLTYQDMDLILYTHIHPDHVADLVPILFACKYSTLPRKKELVCMGGLGFKNFFVQTKKIYGPWIEPSTYSLHIKEISTEPILFRGLKIYAKPMSHLQGSVGFRIELKNRKTIAFSGDTDYCQNIVDLALKVDLLVLECSFPDGQKVEGHLTPSLAGRIATESQCQKLLLTHFYPPCDEVNILQQCQKTFKGEIILGEDLLRIPVE
ncbi:MAG: MBL fold metallo-hydrolase [Thermodesulfobacteriota bacterium]